MIRWLYRYVLRGIGIVFAVGMITALLLAISAQLQRAHRSPAGPSAPAQSARP
jgi:hypothetical protein